MHSTVVAALVQYVGVEIGRPVLMQTDQNFVCSVINL